MLSNKFGEAGQNFSTPDASIEQSQMTNIRAQKARSAPGRNSGAEIMGYPRLPKARDVVQLTFNRKRAVSRMFSGAILVPRHASWPVASAELWNT